MLWWEEEVVRNWVSDSLECGGIVLFFRGFCVRRKWLWRVAGGESAWGGGPRLAGLDTLPFLPWGFARLARMEVLVVVDRNLDLGDGLLDFLPPRFPIGVGDDDGVKCHNELFLCHSFSPSFAPLKIHFIPFFMLFDDFFVCTLSLLYLLIFQSAHTQEFTR